MSQGRTHLCPSSPLCTSPMSPGFFRGKRRDLPPCGVLGGKNRGFLRKWFRPSILASRSRSSSLCGTRKWFIQLLFFGGLAFLTASLASGLALEGDPHARLSMVWSDSSSSLVSALLQEASCFLVSSRLRMERLSELNVGLDNPGTERPTAPRKQTEFHRGRGYIYDD